MEAETTLVRAERGIELHTIATVDFDLALVVLPDDTELDDTLGDGDDLQSLAVLRNLLEESRVLESGRELLVGLLELGFARDVGHGGDGISKVGYSVQ